MSPKSPTSVKSDGEICPPQSEHQERLERPSSLGKRDMIVEFNCEEKTTIRTTELYTNGGGTGDLDSHSNVCQVQEILKGRTRVSESL